MREGAAWQMQGSVYDAGGSACTATVDYGDGQAAQDLMVGADGAFTLSHRWADDGARRVTVLAADAAGKRSQATVLVTVVNVAPRVSAGAGVRLHRGARLRRRGSFADPGADTWKATVDYGDGAGRHALPLTGKTFVLNHRFRGARGRVFTVTVRVRDDDGGAGVARFRVTLT